MEHFERSCCLASGRLYPTLRNRRTNFIKQIFLQRFHHYSEEISNSCFLNLPGSLPPYKSPPSNQRKLKRNAGSFVVHSRMCLTSAADSISVTASCSGHQRPRLPYTCTANVALKHLARTSTISLPRLSIMANPSLAVSRWFFKS